MVQAIICDFDFTLADSSPGVVACVNEALAGLGLPPASVERIHATIGLSLPHTLQALTGIADPAIATEFTRRFVAHADQVMHGLTLLYPWVAETVQALRAAGQRLGIVSSKYRYRIERILAEGGLASQFEVRRCRGSQQSSGAIYGSTDWDVRCAELCTVPRTQLSRECLALAQSASDVWVVCSFLPPALLCDPFVNTPSLSCPSFRSIKKKSGHRAILVFPIGASS